MSLVKRNQNSLTAIFFRFMGPLIALPTRYYYQKCAKFLLPIVKQRMANMERNKTGSVSSWTEPVSKLLMPYVTRLVSQSYNM